MEKRLICTKCKYYYITWDSRYPNGCKCYGIKTRFNPALEVLRATGKGCMCFEKKPINKAKRS